MPSSLKDVLRKRSAISSVAPNDNVPVHQWTYYHFAEKHRSRIARFGKRYGLSADQSGDIAETAAMDTCVSRSIRDDAHAEHFFFEKVKFYLFAQGRRRKTFGHDVALDALSPDGEQQDVEDLLGRHNRNHRALPEHTVYVIQMMKEIEALPTRHQTVMRDLVMGDTPLEIAERERRSVHHVLDDIRVARQWLNDASDSPLSARKKPRGQAYAFQDDQAR